MILVDEPSCLFPLVRGTRQLHAEAQLREPARGVGRRVHAGEVGHDGDRGLGLARVRLAHLRGGVELRRGRLRRA
eukprot:2558308-Alexandrium_andersonii.AAC.1